MSISILVRDPNKLQTSATLSIDAKGQLIAQSISQNNKIVSYTLGGPCVHNIVLVFILPHIKINHRTSSNACMMSSWVLKNHMVGNIPV